ncbi:MAG: hypothetical protein KBS95_01550 [Alistipes sp.]|nr:hypothetical protein [Candidatus Alistipes equi]
MAAVASKKHLMVSYNNLSEELKESMKMVYPYGFADATRRIEKPSGEVVFVVPFETPDVDYLVKIDVTIDNVGDDTTDEELFGDTDDVKGDEMTVEGADDEEDIADDSQADFDGGAM